MEAGPIAMFMEGGWAMWAVLAIGMPAWFFTAIAAGVLLLKRKPFPLVMAGVFPLLCGLIAIMFGAIGYFSGMSTAEQAIELADPQYADMMMAEAERLAVYPVYFGVAVGVIPALVGGLCMILALTMRQSEPQ